MANEMVISIEDVERRAKDLYDKIYGLLPTRGRTGVTEDEVRAMVANNLMILGWTISPKSPNTDR